MNEDLLAIIIDRLQGFQDGPYADPDISVALQHCKDALETMNSRTRWRIDRGIEGTHAI